jgi:translation initiation factor IF-1
MVKNITGGNRTKKQKRGFQRRQALDSTETGQMFGQVLENRGDHFLILCADNVQRLGWLSNSAKKGQRLIANSFVVLSIRDYETEKKNCDVIAAGNPPNDIKNIFRKINPIAGNDDNIEFYTQNDKFKEFEESEATACEVITIKPKTEIGILTKDDSIWDDSVDFKESNVYKEDSINWDDI